VLAASPDRYEAEERARGTTSMFAKYYNSQTEQGLRAHGVDAENVDRFYGSCITREWVDRSMILSIDELAGVAHIPNGEIEVPGIQWRHSKTGSDAPSTAPKDEISESRDYSYSSQSGVSGNDDGSLSVSDDSRPGQSNPDDGSILSESASTHNLERSKTEPETESEAGSTSERTDGGSTSTTTDGSAWDDGPTVDGGITDSHPPAGHEQTAGDNLVASRDGNGYVDAVNEQRAEAIARQFTTDIEASNTAFESIDDVDEEAVREAAHDYTDEDLGEFGSPQSQQAEYAVWDKFEDENPEWASGKRSPAYDAITYVSTPDDGTEEPPTPSDSAVDGATDGQVTVATSTLDESANNELEGEAESSTDIPADVVLPEEFTMECPSSQSPQSYERLTMDGDDYWMCSGCGRTVKRNGVPEHAYETPESDDNSDSQKQTRDRPIGMDRVQLTPAEELFSEYVELLIASVPPDKQHWITADTTVRELIEIIRELEQQDDLVPLSAGVLENTRPDTLSEDEVLDEGRIKLPSQMGLGDDEMVDRPLDALDIAPDEIDSWGVPPADRSPEGSASSPTGSTADTDGIDDRAVDTDDTSATDAAADVDADTEAADVDADTATLLDGEQPADEQPAETHPRPEESNTDATDEPQSETTVNTEQDSDSDSDPDTDTAPDGRGAWWGQDDPDQTTVEANIDDAPEQADSSPFDDEWVDGSTDDSDDDTQHSAETNAEATDPTTTTTNERH